MKILNRMIVCVTAAVLCLALPAFAQYRATGDDGITASPKVRQALIEQGAAKSVVADTSKPTACANCKNEYLTREDWTVKGLIKPKVTSVKHLCPGCETSVSVIGGGKAKHDVVTHKCDSCRSVALTCCSVGKANLAR